MALIKLENIKKEFGSNDNKVEALKGIDLEINRGELIAIIGASGSGKSTLLNIIGLLDKATGGKYFYDEKDITSFTDKELGQLRNKAFGFVVQNFALIKEFTVYENVEIPLTYNKNIKKREYKDRIENILMKLGIIDKINKKPSELSGGQCQRVAIARALINDASIILADEPTGALDKKNGMDVINEFLKLNQEGKTVIMVTHDESIADKCNKIIRIEDGIIKGIRG